jgi:hypothetical protein
MLLANAAMAFFQPGVFLSEKAGAIAAQSASKTTVSTHQTSVTPPASIESRGCQTLLNFWGVDTVRQRQAIITSKKSPPPKNALKHGAHPPNFGDAATEWRLNAEPLGGGHLVGTRPFGACNAARVYRMQESFGRANLKFNSTKKRAGNSLCCIASPDMGPYQLITALYDCLQHELMREERLHFVSAHTRQVARRTTHGGATLLR